MFMIKNAWKQIRHQPWFNGFIILLLSACVAAITVTLSLRKTTNTVKNAYDETIGTEVYVTQSYNNGLGSTSGSTVSVQTLKDIGKSEYVKDMELYYMIPITSQALIENNGDLQIGEIQTPKGMLMGYNQPQYIGDDVVIQSGSMYAKEGDVIISGSFALRNNLSVGSSIEITTLEKDKTLALTVSGIYQRIDTNGSQKNYADDSYIYTSSETIEAYRSQLVNPGAIEVGVMYTLNQAKDLNLLRAEAKALGLSDSLTLSTNDRYYGIFVSPLTNLSDTVMIYTITGVVAAGLLLLVLALYDLKRRNQEIHYLSMIGMGRTDIAKTFIFELLILLVIGLVVGILLGTVLVNPIAQTIHLKEMQMFWNLQSKGSAIYKTSTNMWIIMGTSIVAFLVMLVPIITKIRYIQSYEIMEHLEGEGVR